jgi:serine O-acetyltransferase
MGRQLFSYVKRDLNRCGEQGSEQLREVLFNPGVWAVLSYRLRRKIYSLRIPKPLRKLLSLFSNVLQLCTVVMTNIDLPVTAEIGPGLYIPHSGCIVVTVGARIGCNCTLTQGVTIGHARGGKRSNDGMPVIGDRVYVGPSSVIIGGINVGNDALIGAGAIVVRSVPAGGVVVGNPARVISTRGSFDLISYPDMSGDKDRTAALVALRPPLHLGIDLSMETGECLSANAKY